ncbi:hypothetical protein Tco_0608043 [Tanacetum coccineum]
MIVMMSMIELESLFGPLFDEYFNGENLVVSKSSAVTSADASDKRQQQLDSISSTSTLATTITADGNFDLCITPVSNVTGEIAIEAGNPGLIENVRVVSSHSSKAVLQTTMLLLKLSKSESFNIKIVDSNLPTIQDLKVTTKKSSIEGDC